MNSVYISIQDAIWLLTDKHTDGFVYLVEGPYFIDGRIAYGAGVTWKGESGYFFYHMEPEDTLGSVNITFPSYEPGLGVRLS